MESNLSTAIERSIIFKLGEAELTKLRMQAVINQQQQQLEALSAQLKAAQAEIENLKFAAAAAAVEPELPMKGLAHVNGGAKH